jgi:hypothetical protein
MRRHGLAAILIATLVVLAGCTGGVGPGVGSTDDTTGTAAMDGTGSGTVQFYISDQPSAIEDFEHLNVTITQVGFQQADGDDEDDEESNETDDSETEEEESEDEDSDDADEDDDSEAGDWETYDVDDRTVDLTRLQGANATRLTSMNVSNGTYSTVFVYVSEINATLENGEQVNVKLPSEKLQLNTEFTVGNGRAVDFVFDITVKKAGNSGKYILQPVVSESGTSEDVEIEKIDEDDEDEREEEDREDRGNDENVGTTNADGELTFVVSDDRDLEVEITAGDREAELERTFADKESGSENGGNGNDDADYDLQITVA